MSERSGDLPAKIQNAVDGRPDLKNRSNPISSRAKWLRPLAAAVISAGLGSAEAADRDNKTEHLLSPEQSEIVEQVIGVSYAELKEGYVIDMPVRADENGKYIVHFAQTHLHPKNESRASSQDRVIESQKKLEPLILSMIDKNRLSCIFAEGVTDEQTSVKLKEDLNAGSERIETVMGSSIRTYADFSNALDVFANYYNQMSNPFIYHYLGPKLEALRVKIVNGVERGQIKAEKPVESALMQFAATELEASKIDPENYPTHERPDPYTLGVDFKIFMDNRVSEFCVVEGEFGRASARQREKVERMEEEYLELNETVAKEALDKDVNFKVLYDRVNNLKAIDPDKLTVSERRELTEKLRSLETYLAKDPRISAYKNHLLKEQDKQQLLYSIIREREALRFIDLYDKDRVSRGQHWENVALLYGYGHNFDQALIDWNNKNSDESIDRGLIKVSPKLTKKRN